MHEVYTSNISLPSSDERNAAFASSQQFGTHSNSDPVTQHDGAFLSALRSAGAPLAQDGDVNDIRGAFGEVAVVCDYSDAQCALSWPGNPTVQGVYTEGLVASA